MNKRLLRILFLLSMTSLACDESTILSGVRDGEKLKEGSPIEFLLHQNYPNPFNPETRIQYETGIVIHLRMRVFTEDWQEVRTLVNKQHDPSVYAVSFDGRNSEGESLPSGEYIYTLEGNGLTLIRSMKLVK